MRTRKAFSGRPKSQSAMEYLMTYGWAILIIAVVLGALYYLGVFNTANLAPRAQPGSCKVVRPNGPSTTTFINLAGICSGQLPLFVGQFDGATSYVNLIQMTQETGTNPMSFSEWFYSTSLPNNFPNIFSDANMGVRNGYDIFVYGSSGYPTFVEIERFSNNIGSNNIATGSIIYPNTWYLLLRHTTAAHCASILMAHLLEQKELHCR